MTDLPIKIIFIYLINYINFKIIIHPTSEIIGKKEYSKTIMKKNY